MDEILTQLPADSFVLDLGAQKGSFASKRTKAKPIRLDAAPLQAGGELVVCANAADLPFSDRFFAAIIANHSLEHFENLRACLREIGRVIRNDGALFVSVPDSTTFTDRLYRWLACGGGHVNPFASATELARCIELETGLTHVATRTLYSSLSFLNRRNSFELPPRRLWLLGNGSEWSLAFYVWFSRFIDRMFGFRSSVYGWAMYFGNIAGPIDSSIRSNVCIRCGSGVSTSVLYQLDCIRSNSVGIRFYRCPGCATVNPFIDK